MGLRSFLTKMLLYLDNKGKMLLFFLSSQDRWVDVKRGKEIQWQMGACVCVRERSVWTLIAVQALMVRAQLCVCAEYWSPSNFSWSDPSQPDNTHTHTWEHSADSRSRSWDDTQVNTDRISKKHKLSVSALASDWPTGLIASDCFTNLSLYYIFIWCVIKRLSLVWRLNYIQENMFRSEFKPLIMGKITWTGEIWQFNSSLQVPEKVHMWASAYT